MNKKMLGGIIVLIALVGIVGVFLLIRHKTDTEPKKVYKAPSEEVLEKVRDDLVVQKTPKAQDTAKTPPPGETHETGHWDGDHWHRTAPVNTQPSDGEYGVTRQGTRYLKNPAWADRAEAHAIPTDPALDIDWRAWANLDTRTQLDWYDPRTWEAYRNFWGFDRPHVLPDGSPAWIARLDNWGTPLQQFQNVSLVVKYSKRIGFRPTPEQFAEHQELSARYKTAQDFGDTATTESLRHQIAELEPSAQGELPDPTSYFSTSYGDPHPNWDNLSDGEKRKINKEEEAVGVRNLYKRLGIEHLYEYYEKP